MILLKIIGISVGFLLYLTIGIIIIKKLSSNFLIEVEEGEIDFVVLPFVFPIVMLYVIAREISNYIINHGK